MTNNVLGKSATCWDCNGRGIILADLKEPESPSTGVFVFKCLCPIGKSDLRNYPIWKDSFSSQFVRHALVDVSDVAALPTFPPAPVQSFEPIKYDKQASGAADDDWLD
jgi:hypothetical protein